MNWAQPGATLQQSEAKHSKPALKQLAFTEAEYRRRLASVQAAMRQQGIDALLCTALANICYLTGVESPSVHSNWFTLVPSDGLPVMLLTEFECHNARVGSWLNEWVQLPLSADVVDAAASLVLDAGFAGKRVSIESGRFSSLTPADHLRLREKLAREVKLVETSELVERIRTVKSPAEVEYMRQAGRISVEGMRAALEAIAAGKTDNAVAAAAYHTIISRGSEYPCYPPFIAAGSRSGIPHTTFRRTSIGPGDALFMEVGACMCRYSSPMMRTAVVGKPSDEVRRLHDACQASVETMIKTLRPGIPASEVAKKSSLCLEDLPPHLIWHGYFGYSVGLGFPPSWADCTKVLITRQNPFVLQAGMTYHCSTSLRDVGRFGVCCSETLLITEDGCEVLTKGLERELFVR